MTLKERQQHPHTYSFARPRVKFEGPWWMLLLEFNLHTSYSKLVLILVNFCLATMQSWVIEQWNDSEFRFLALPA